ncbi:c-type cytochrome [Aquimarina sp. ERC-38]|uniref:c-type cytochrome n=1 Tax=Aquimarina sp. ERC-38 TaxID=2949996 RepID=UPI002246E802|nr:c-type cytochrome [Aquimarina sp. ERC-38]UZO82001.1 c-type cytochrome [Aquimarina sp. ERC-38]
MKTNLIPLIVSFGLLLNSCNTSKEEKTSNNIKLKNQTQLSQVEIGQKLYKGKGNCTSCHQLYKNSIGPSIQEIVGIYKEQNADMIAFLKQEGKPIVKPEQYSVMKTNFAVLKTFSQEELEALTAYMYSIVDRKE